MRPLRFVHAADLHLDSPFKALIGRSDGQVAATLANATFAAYENIIDFCIAERVDALLIAGDIYDGADRSLRAQLRFGQGLQRLTEHGIRSFICHGNHDPLDGWEARIAFPPGCIRFGPEVQAVPIDPQNPERGTVYGMSYPARDERRNLASRFQRVPGDGFAIGLLHANVDGNPEHELYAPCTLDDLSATGMDYWALGHVHTRKVFPGRGQKVVYPGNPQGRHAYEPGARGVYLVDVNERGEASLDFRAMDVVRWQTLRLTIDGLEDEQALINLLHARCEKALACSEGRHVVCRIELAGSGELHRSLQRPGHLADLRDSLNQCWSRRSTFLWCERLTAATGPAFDRTAALSAGDFVAEMLAIADTATCDPAVAAVIEDQLRELYNHHALRRYLRDATPCGSARRELIAAAESLCIDALGGQS